MLGVRGPWQLPYGQGVVMREDGERLCKRNDCGMTNCLVSALLACICISVYVNTKGI